MSPTRRLGTATDRERTTQVTNHCIHWVKLPRCLSRWQVTLSQQVTSSRLHCDSSCVNWPRAAWSQTFIRPTGPHRRRHCCSQTGPSQTLPVCPPAHPHSPCALPCPLALSWGVALGRATSSSGAGGGPGSPSPPSAGRADSCPDSPAPGSFGRTAPWKVTGHAKVKGKVGWRQLLN